MKELKEKVVHCLIQKVDELESYTVPEKGKSLREDIFALTSALNAIRYSENEVKQ